MYRLVIIDDEKMILNGIAEIFPWKNIGFAVTGRFTSAGEALVYLEQEPVDVVLTDISMPDMNGLELAQELKKYPDLLIVVFSSYHNYEYMRQALQLDITDYLLKPVNYDELSSSFEKVRQLLDERNAQKDDNEATYYEQIVRRVDEHIKASYQNTSLAAAAEITGISVNYLSKLYKEYKGIGFAESLNRVRMEKAMELLNDPQYKSYEIAYHVGYESPKNFTRAFKAFYHVTPRDYRNGIRSKDQNL